MRRPNPLCSRGTDTSLGPAPYPMPPPVIAASILSHPCASGRTMLASVMNIAHVTLAGNTAKRRDATYNAANETADIPRVEEHTMDDRLSNAPDGSNGGPVAGAVQMNRPWLAHYSHGVPAEVSDFDHALPWILDEAVRHYGANVAINYFGATISYVELSSLVDRFARELVRLGLKRGDRVSLCLPNVPQFVIAFYGVLKAGGVALRTHPLYTAPELPPRFPAPRLRMPPGRSLV